ncbi:hypothetical protein NA57DRAFT_75073 [Rhizodiscina lignyota]|uniref:Uncharacterized protein n=1 Tax=Rhizodiscina lignyota TaxID=1504668 RepID=A0A9P4IJD1_9PEZI|nr:hypothetical protein NA57DRAFT_75073 [Rhizodiscina lignyota]
MSGAYPPYGWVRPPPYFYAPGPGPPPPIPTELRSSKPVPKVKKTELNYREGNWPTAGPASSSYASFPRAYPIPAPPQYAVGFRYQQPQPKSRLVEVSESEEKDEGSSSSSEEEEKEVNVFRYLVPQHGAQQQQIVSVQQPPQSQTLMIPFHYCVQCMRPRSQGYHRHHPLVPGQPPIQGTCSNCEKRNKAIVPRKPSGTMEKSGMSLSDGEPEYLTKSVRVQVTNDDGERKSYTVRRLQRSGSENTSPPVRARSASPKRKTYIRIRHVSPKREAPPKRESPKAQMKALSPARSPSPDIVSRVIRFASEGAQESPTRNTGTRVVRRIIRQYPSAEDFLSRPATRPPPPQRRDPSPELIYRTVYRTTSERQQEKRENPEPARVAPMSKPKPSRTDNVTRSMQTSPIEQRTPSPDITYRRVHRTTSTPVKQTPRSAETAQTTSKMKTRPRFGSNEPRVSFSQDQQTDIRKMRRDYYDSRLEAERRIASHPAPFSHGRFVPVANDERPQQTTSQIIVQRKAQSPQPPKPQEGYIERQTPIVYRTSAEGPYHGSQRKSVQVSKTTAKSPPQERPSQTKTTIQRHREEVYYSSSHSRSPSPPLRQTHRRSPEKKRSHIYHPLLPHLHPEPTVPRLPAPLDKVGSNASSSTGSPRARVYNQDGPEPSPTPSSSSRQESTNSNGTGGRRAQKEPERGRAHSRSRSFTETLTDSAERVTNAVERTGRSFGRMVTGGRPQRLRSAMRDPSRARDRTSSSSDEGRDGGRGGRKKGRRSADMDSMAVHIGDANHVHFGPEVKRGEGRQKGEGEEIGLVLGSLRGRERARDKGRVYEIDSEEEFMIQRQVKRRTDRDQPARDGRDDVVRRRDESVEIETDNETERPGRRRDESVSRSRSVSRPPSPYVDDDFLSAKSKRRNSVSTAASGSSTRGRIGEDDGRG